MKLGKHDIESYMTLSHEFDGIRILDHILTPVKWNVEIDLVAVDTTSNKETTEEMQVNGSTTYQKILFWLETSMAGCVFVNTHNKVGMDIAMVTDNLLMHCPDDPTDDLIITLLHSKVHTIANGHLHIGQVRLVSTDTAAKYTYNVPSTGYGLPTKVKDYISLPSLYRKPWWERNDGFCFEFLKPKGCKEKLVDLYGELEDPLVAFATQLSAYDITFELEQEPAEIIQVEKWQPKTV